MKKGVASKSVLLVTILLLASQFVLAEVIQIQQDTQPAKKGFFSSYLGFLKSPIFWWIVIGFILLIAIIIGLFFLIRWLIQFFKNRNDLWWKLKTERLNLAKIHRRYGSVAWLRITRNIPIRLVREVNGKPTISVPIAYYRGDYVTPEGNVLLALNFRDNKKWFILPINDNLVITNKKEITIQVRNDKGKTKEIEIKNLPLAKDIIQFNENEILIYAESIASEGQFHVPVLKTKEGKIIDLTMPIYQSLKEVVATELLYEQTDEFSKVMKKTIDMNPNLKYTIKASDSNQSVEVPQQVERQ
jgi:hypothetical protein